MTSKKTEPSDAERADPSAVKPPNRERLRQELKSYMDAQGLRSTGQRRLVIDIFFDTHEHLTIDELLEIARAHDDRISYATVYRTMKMLASGGIAHELHFGDGPTRFELADEDAHHDHLICIECGAIIEFEEPLIEELQLRVALKYGFEVLDHKHEIYGKCPECRRRKDERTKN